MGYIYIQNGNFNIKASSDAIQATTVCQIDSGTFNLTGAEGIEATYIQINGGDFDIYATDDGINGAQKSKSFGTPTIEFNGGTIIINGTQVNSIPQSMMGGGRGGMMKGNFGRW